MVKHLVVARYNRDVAWLEQCRGFDRVFVYDKGPEPIPGSIRLPNVGIDSHVYLNHIIEHYDDLPDVTVFCQDYPFDHAPDFVPIVNAGGLPEMQAANYRRYPDSLAYAYGFLGIGEFRQIHEALIDLDPALRDEPEHQANQRRKYRLIDAIWAHVFPGRPVPEKFPCTWGSQLVLSRERIRVNRVEVYEYLRDLHLQDWLMPYAIENLWWFLFQCDAFA